MEKELERIDRRLERVEANQSEFTRITLILEQQVEINKKQSEVLDKVNENLSNLNGRFNSLDTEVEELKSEVKGITERDNISMSLTIKKYFGLFLSGIVSAGVTALVVWLGLR